MTSFELFQQKFVGLFLAFTQQVVVSCMLFAMCACLHVLIPLHKYTIFVARHFIFDSPSMFDIIQTFSDSVIQHGDNIYNNIQTDKLIQSDLLGSTIVHCSVVRRSSFVARRREIPYAVSNARPKIYSWSHFRLYALSLKACKHQSKFIALAANFTMALRFASNAAEDGWMCSEEQVFTIARRAVLNVLR